MLTKLESTQTALTQAKIEVQKPFERLDELKSKIEKLKEVNAKIEEMNAPKEKEQEQEDKELPQKKCTEMAI